MEKTTIANYFNSQDFLKVLAMVTPEEPNYPDITSNVGELMERAFNFMKLTNFTAEPEQVTDFLIDIANLHNQTSDKYYEQNYNTIFLKHYCKNNSIDFNQINTTDYNYLKTDLTDYLASNIYKFHGTNESFIPSIKENGLQPSASPNRDIEEIDQIFLSHGREHIFPWKKSDRGNDVFFSKTPKVSYSYAVRSPEWFDVFAGQNYATRNYEGARRHVQDLTKQYNLTEQEQERVGDFFEKYWDMYAKGNPTIIAIPDSKDESLDMAKFAVEMASQTSSVEEAINIGFWATGNDAVDASTKDKIDMSDAIFIEMPDIKTIQEQLATIRAENKMQQNLDSLSGKTINNNSNVIQNANSSLKPNPSTQIQQELGHIADQSINDSAHLWMSSKDPLTAVRFSTETQDKIDATAQQFKNTKGETDFQHPASFVENGSSQTEKEVVVNMYQAKNRFYSLKFNYSTPEQQQEVGEIVDKLISSYGANSEWQQSGGRYIMPRLANEDKGTASTSPLVEDILVPDELVKTISRQFVDENKMTICASGKLLAGKFDENDYKQMIDGLRPNASIQPADNGMYSLNFNYSSPEQQKEVKDIVDNLLNSYGANSEWQQGGGRYIMPRLIDDNGETSIDSNIVGDMLVPAELLKTITQQFVDENNMVINVGEQALENKFDEETYKTMLDSLSQTTSQQVNVDQLSQLIEQDVSMEMN